MQNLIGEEEFIAIPQSPCFYAVMNTPLVELVKSPTSIEMEIGWDATALHSAASSFSGTFSKPVLRVAAEAYSLALHLRSTTVYELCGFQGYSFVCKYEFEHNLHVSTKKMHQHSRFTRPLNLNHIRKLTKKIGESEKHQWKKPYLMSDLLCFLGLGSSTEKGGKIKLRKTGFLRMGLQEFYGPLFAANGNYLLVANGLIVINLVQGHL
nr:hypothetical protein Iba_chr13fCG8750 [Ipomoea batatas]